MWDFVLFQPVRSVSSSMQWVNVNDDDDDDDEDAEKEIAVVVEWKTPVIVFNQINEFRITYTINNVVENILVNTPRITIIGDGRGSGEDGRFKPGDNVEYQVTIIYIVPTAQIII
jgi:hypothetical protein